MTYENVIRKAAAKTQIARALMEEPFYQQTMAWLGYLGLLRHNTIAPGRFHVHLRDALNAGDLEPRVLEILPAIMILIPDAFQYETQDIPADLADVIRGIATRCDTNNFRGVPARKYCQWLHAPVIDIARRRLDYRKAPRKRRTKTNFIGEIIRDGRAKLALTQKQMAKQYDVPLRVLRDLEQGGVNTSLKSANKILSIFGRSLRA